MKNVLLVLRLNQQFLSQYTLLRGCKIEAEFPPLFFEKKSILQTRYEMINRIVVTFDSHPQYTANLGISDDWGFFTKYCVSITTPE
ncbi:hypothetical protein VIN01S_02230 [Vibrio inusitatus NBRC 102082]|uniref:Uncharacterized protein n=1 Tax=Vibrio inusitatus NBRC 102082 TaxID=1219070 RepID=A0A4Y3HQI9_9VIBR|nr:hypothetical protein VIN01S_02230 [Vibrio inusitatus NBRC 102082]